MILAAVALAAGAVVPSADQQRMAEQARRTLTFAFAGDVMMGTNYPDESRGAYLPAYGGRYLFDDAGDVLREADVAAVNLEGTLFDRGGKPKDCSDPKLCYVFRTPAAFVGNLVDAGIDFVSMANNHVNDFGASGREQTMRNLSAAGIEFAGLRDVCETSTIERGGKRIGFAAFGHSRGTLSIMDIDEVRTVVGSLKDSCDIVVVSFHGGGEGPKYTHVPHGMEMCFNEQRGDVELFAHEAVEAGADIVYGHGPHVTRGMEVYRDRLIMYSLGNFCTPYRVNLNGISGHAPVVEVTVDGDGNFVRGKIHPFVQKRGAGPRTDSSGAVIRQIRRLSESDFPSGCPDIADDGTFTVKRKME